MHKFGKFWHRDHDHHDYEGHRHMRRHGRHHGFADIGGFMEGRRGMGRGRKLAAQDLQLVILALLAEQPRHGYELIKELDERSGGFYAPSPGMIYPALTYLEEVGHASVETEGTKKRYSITAEGKAHLAGNRPVADAMLSQLGRFATKMDRMRRFMSGEPPAAGEGDEEPREMSDELMQVRRNLKALVFEKADAPIDEQRRVAAILRKAIDEIVSK